MSAPHFFSDDLGDTVVVLRGDEAKHAVRALRVRPGETITIGDGRGTVVTATVEEAAGTVRAAVVARRTVGRPHPRVVVYPAVPKSGKLELIVQKLTELGVDAIVPWFAERTVVRWDRTKASAHGERLRAVAREAAKQSRRAWLPDVVDPQRLPAPAGHVVVLHEDEHGTLLRDVLPGSPDEVALVIGPEGGLTDDEVAGLRAAGARVAGLGEQILRAETAAIVGAALVLSRYGRLG